MPTSPPNPSSLESPSPPRRSGKANLFAYVGNRFFAGLAVAIPLIVTIWILALSYQFILYVGRPVIEAIFHGINLGLDRTEAAGNLITPPEWFLNLFAILTPLILFIALGVMATNVLGAKIFGLVDRLVLKFPVISFIYSGLKQVMDSFRNFGAGRNFKRVAYVEYPAPGCRLIGFVTGQYHDAQIGKNVTSIFIPTSPNPMTGFVIVVEDDKVFESSLTIEQATKLILSAGLVAPEFPSSISPTAPVSSDKASASPDANQVSENPPPQAGSKRSAPGRERPTPIASPPETARRSDRFNFDRPGKDPVVRHDETAGTGSSPLDGPTGFEDEDF